MVIENCLLLGNKNVSTILPIPVFALQYMSTTARALFEREKIIHEIKHLKDQ